MSSAHNKPFNWRTILGVVIVVIIGIAIFNNQHSDPTLPQIDEGVEQPRNLSPSTKKIRIDTNRYQALVAGLQAMGNEVELAESQPEDPDEPNVRELTYTEITQRELVKMAIGEEYLERARPTLDSILEEQRPNPLWTKMVTQELNEKLNFESLAGSSLDEASCYETMCKVVINHDDRQAADTFGEQATEAGKLDGPGLVFIDGMSDDTFQSVQYVGRYGEDELVHGALENRMYEDITGADPSDIQPTQEQVAAVTDSIKQAADRERQNFENEQVDESESN